MEDIDFKTYSKGVLRHTRQHMSDTFVYIEGHLGITMADFWQCFLHSWYCKQFEALNHKVIYGLSYAEFAKAVLQEHNIPCVVRGKTEDYSRMTTEWTGAFIVYYQWHTQLPFAEIEQHVPPSEISGMFSIFDGGDYYPTMQRLDEIIQPAIRW